MLSACAAWDARAVLGNSQKSTGKGAQVRQKARPGPGGSAELEKEAMNMTMTADTASGVTKNNAAGAGGMDAQVEKKKRRKSTSSRSLKKHLKYMIPEYRLALIKEPGAKFKPLLCAKDVELFVEPLKHYSEEHFVSFHLNSKFEVIGHHMVSHGTVSASLVHPREVFKAALLNNSYAIIVAHNHPGGSLKPSAEDIATTRTLIEAGRILGISVLDHVIVASSGHFSLREEHQHLWES